mgnify:CR=1 FL=1
MLGLSIIIFNLYLLFIRKYLFSRYCDGLIHIGRDDNFTIYYNGTTLYFRGGANSKATFDYLIKNLGMNSAETVLLSGS